MKSEAEQVYCTRCGKQIKGEYLFCNYCGEPVKRQKSSVRADSENMKTEEKTLDAVLKGLKSVFFMIKKLMNKNLHIKRVVCALIAGIVWVIAFRHIPSDIRVDWRGIFAIYTDGSNLKVDASVDPDERIINLVVLGIMQKNGDYLYDALPREYRDSSPGSLRSFMVEELTNYSLNATSQINEELGYEWKWMLRSKKLEEYRDEENAQYDLDDIKYEIERTYDAEPTKVAHVSVVITAKARSSIKTYSLRIPFNIFRSEYGWALDYKSFGKGMDEQS